MDVLSFGEVVGEAFGIADTAPRLEAYERAALFVRCPDTVSIRLRAIDIQDGVAVSIPQLDLRHLTLFDNQGIMTESLRHEGRFLEQHHF